MYFTLGLALWISRQAIKNWGQNSEEWGHSFWSLASSVWSCLFYLLSSLEGFGGACIHERSYKRDLEAELGQTFEWDKFDFHVV